MTCAANLTPDNHTLLPYYMHSAGTTVIYIILYLLVLVLCVLGNGLVCLVVIKNRHMRSVTNLFILNLAISDLLVGIFCVPTTLIDSLISGWPFGQITCTISNTIQGMSVTTSVFTLVAIAVDRFMGIVYPFHHRMRPVTALFTIIFIWLLSFAIIFPSAATLMVIHLDDMFMVQDDQICPLSMCLEDWPSANMQRVYTMVIFIQVYLAPLCLISILYICITVKLSNNLLKNRVRSKRIVKIIMMLIMINIFFMVSWLPLWTLILLTDYQDLDRHQIDFMSRYLFPAAHWLAFFNSGVNPIIYGFFNKKFQRGFKAVCSSCRSFMLDMRHTQCVLLPPNRVSDGNHDVTSRRKERCLTAMPQEIGHGIQGILLEDMNGIKDSHRVIGAWM